MCVTKGMAGEVTLGPLLPLKYLSVRSSMHPNPEQARVMLPAKHRPCQATSDQLCQ